MCIYTLIARNCQLSALANSNITWALSSSDSIRHFCSAKSLTQITTGLLFHPLGNGFISETSWEGARYNTNRGWQGVQEWLKATAPHASFGCALESKSNWPEGGQVGKTGARRHVSHMAELLLTVHCLYQLLVELIRQITLTSFFFFCKSLKLSEI